MRARVAVTALILVLVGTVTPPALAARRDSQRGGSAGGGVERDPTTGRTSPFVRVDRPASPGRSDSSGGGITTANG